MWSALTVDNGEDMNFVIIEDRLPAGFESETRNDPRFTFLQLLGLVLPPGAA
jgi:hypothetical protein